MVGSYWAIAQETNSYRKQKKCTFVPNNFDIMVCSRLIPKFVHPHIIALPNPIMMVTSSDHHIKYVQHNERKKEVVGM